MKSMELMKDNIFKVLSLVMIFSYGCNYAQTKDGDWDLMLVREDRVKPSKVADYEAALMDKKIFLEENNVTNYTYFSHMMDNYNFTHVTPIERLNDLEQGILEYIKHKVNNPEFDLIVSDIFENIETYRYYIIRYHHELSHVPPNNSWESGSPYRKWNYYYFKPGKEKEVERILASWHSLYNKHEINNGYRIFSGFTGLYQPLYIFTVWAEDPTELQRNLQDNMTLFGEEGAILWTKTMEYVHKVETFEGWYLPQYSYTNNKKLASPK
jgi:hypothetical protein